MKKILLITIAALLLILSIYWYKINLPKKIPVQNINEPNPNITEEITAITKGPAISQGATEARDIYLTINQSKAGAYLSSSVSLEYSNTPFCYVRPRIDKHYKLVILDDLQQELYTCYEHMGTFSISDGDGFEPVKSNIDYTEHIETAISVPKNGSWLELRDADNIVFDKIVLP
jgi:hypothetical protein